MFLRTFYRSDRGVESLFLLATAQPTGENLRLIPKLGGPNRWKTQPSMAEPRRPIRTCRQFRATAKPCCTAGRAISVSYQRPTLRKCAVAQLVTHRAKTGDTPHRCCRLARYQRPRTASIAVKIVR